MEKISELKSRVSIVLKVLRTAIDSGMTNILTARLNDCAFKAIKGGNQKKLDDRAVRNDAFFKANDAKVKSIASTIDVDKIRATYKDIIGSIGDCPLSMCDVADLLQSGDCMGICLQITRSEAAINNPTKLVVHKIVPTFMSCDSFLESSIFHLEQDQQAHGGFDFKNQGSLALGIGRESVTGILPLFLFKEHRDMMRLKMQPLLGFMCCLDPMGYSPSQSFAVPYAVLLKAMEDVSREPSEINKLILKLVTDTCQDIITSNAEHKKQVTQMMEKFMESPEHRTADVVESVQLLTAQISTLASLQNENDANDQQMVVEGQNDIIDFKTFGKLAIEEIHRRNLKNDVHFDKDKILKTLMPNYRKVVNEYKATYQEQIEQSVKKAETGDKYAQYQTFAS